MPEYIDYLPITKQKTKRTLIVIYNTPSFFFGNAQVISVKEDLQNSGRGAVKRHAM